MLTLRVGGGEGRAGSGVCQGGREPEPQGVPALALLPLLLPQAGRSCHASVVFRGHESVTLALLQCPVLGEW